jgi:signal peptidase I
MTSGCGGGGSVGEIQSTFAGFVHAMQQHKVAAACNEVTPAYWSGLAGDLNSHLVAFRQSLAGHDCREGLTQLFKLEGRGTTSAGGASVIDVNVRGNTASARQFVRGRRGGPIRFVKEKGHWRISCCAGRQLEQLPTATWRVPSPSMLPTLRIGQTVVSDNAALREHPPPLGAIVVFHPPAGADPTNPRCAAPREGSGFRRPCRGPTPDESPQTFIKRIVGLPGDRIAMVNGTVIRNGKPEPRNYKVRACGAGSVCSFPQPITVPPDEYFVLGDNLGESDDSRFWGPVKRAWLIGLIKTP